MDAVAIVNSGCDEGVDQGFCSRQRRVKGMGYVFEVEEGSSGDFINVLLKGKVVVKYDSEVATVWAGRQGGLVKGEAEILSGFDEGFGAYDEHVQFVTVQLEEVRLHPGFYFSEAVGECGVSDTDTDHRTFVSLHISATA